VDPGPPGEHDRRPWHAGRSRALYSRRIQRADERWGLTTRAAAGLLGRPELVLGALGHTEPVERDGRVLNRGVQALIELATRFDRTQGGEGPPADPVVMRRQMRSSSRLAMPVRTDVHAWGRVVPGPEGAPPVPVRIYRRFGSGVGLGGEGRLVPAVVYYHGGGWVTGDLDSHDASCRMLAAAARCLVVAVDYRLAPEHPFPAAVDDALAAYAWVQRNAGALGVDPRQVGVMGDSAGGNLAAVVALEARAGGRSVADDVLPPVVQGLIYPVLDARLDTESVRTLGEGFFLTLASMEHFRELYLPDPADWTDGRASPLMAGDHGGVAPALVVTAGFDPLRDDGSRYAEVLRAAGVEVEYRCYDDQVHGFLGMGILPDSLALATEVFESMGRLIRRPTAAASPA
jgi:acetyl esterase